MAYKDLTEALEEKRSREEPTGVSLFGRDFAVRKPSGRLAFKMQQLVGQYGNDVPDTEAEPILRDLLGDEQFDELMDMVAFDELPIVLEAVQEAAWGAASNGDGEGDASGEAPGPPSPTSLDSSRRSRPTSSGSTASTSPRSGTR